MARLPIPGKDSGTWGSILNDYLSQTHKSDGTLKDDSVGSAQLANNAVTNSAIAPDAITATEIQDGSILEAQLGSGVQTKLNAAAPTWSTLTGKPAVVAAGSDAGTARDTINAAGISGGLLAVSGSPVSAEQVSAQPLGSRIVIPAAELQAAGGITSVTRSNLDGCPVLAFQRSPIRVIDTFNRADSASTAGSTDTGETWTASGTWGIQSNRLYNPSAGNGNRLTVTLAANDCDVSATMAVLPGTSSVSLMHRWADASNYVYLSILSTGVVQLGNVIGGSFTTLATSSSSVVSAGQKITLRTFGTTATALVDGISVLTATTAIASGTAAGLRNAGDSTGNFRFDDFSISDDQRVSGFITLPAHWETFDIACLYTTLSSGSGNVAWQYSENPVDLSSGTSLGLVSSTVVTSTTLSSGMVQRAYLATDHAVPSDKMIAFGITRRNSSLLDTYTNSVGLLAVELTQNT
jgi:hypothetical protein